MTLNLMLLTRHAVFLSGDFRLTLGDGTFEDDLEVQKIVPVLRDDWIALVAFCGVARTSNGVETGDWIEQATARIAADAPLAHLESALSKATSIVRALRMPAPLTISVVGFNRRRPFGWVFSNCIRPGKGHPAPPGREFLMTRFSPRECRAAAFGDVKPPVTSHLKGILNSLGNTQDFESISRAVADLNDLAAKTSNSISPACVVGYILPTGASAVTPFRIDHEMDYLPPWVRRRLIAQGTKGIVRQRKEDETECHIRWLAMTARLERASPTEVREAVLLAFDGVERFIQGDTPKNVHVFTKRKEEGDPPFVEIRFSPQDTDSN